MKETFSRKRTRLGIALMALSLVAAACGSDTATTTAPADTTAGTEAPADTTAGTEAPADTTAAMTGLETACALGAEEGSFVYWATVEADNFVRIIEPFEARYPDIEIQFLSIREEDGAQRILTSISAGQKPEPDMIYGSQDGIFPIIDRGLLDTDFDWAALGIEPDMIHATSNMVRLFAVGLGLAYNTNLGSPDDLPATWEELIDSKYAADLVVDPRGNPFDLLSIAWGQEETLDYAKRLKDVVEPIIIKGGTAGMTEVLSGGALMTTSGRADSNAELRADGAPIDMHYMDYVPVRVVYNGMMKDAVSPNAAACFAGWLASPEGKASFESVEFKSNDFPPAGVPEGAILVSVGGEADAQVASDTGALVAEILAPDFEG